MRKNSSPRFHCSFKNLIQHNQIPSIVKNKQMPDNLAAQERITICEIFIYQDEQHFHACLMLFLSRAICVLEEIRQCLT